MMEAGWRKTACVVWVLAFSSLGRGATPLTDGGAEKAAVAGDWAAVERITGGQDPLGAPSALRLLRAHACLATNRNNEAIGLFSRATREDLESWQAWSESLAARSPQSATAHYLAGDAGARRKEWERAMRSFDEALILDPGHALALNARGVAHAVRKQWDDARDDFERAEKVAPALADVHASHGTFIIQRRTDPQKALEYYGRAVDESPTSLLALNGRACARILLREWERAREDLEKADKLAAASLPVVGSILAMNLDLLLAERNKRTDALLAKVSGLKPGTSLQEQLRHFRGLSPGQKQLYLDVLNNAHNFNRSIQGNFLIPQLSLSGAGGVKKGLIGPTPYVEARLTANWDVRKTAEFNANCQERLLSGIKAQCPDLTPNRISNFKAFVLQKATGIGLLTEPGGISSQEMGLEPLDDGEWKVVVLYGLAYEVADEGQTSTGGPGAEKKGN